MRLASRFISLTAVAVTLATTVAFVARRDASRQPSIEVTAPVPVSDSGSAFVEPFIAADPIDPRRLIVTASEIDPAHGVEGRVFVSNDRGLHWHSPMLPEIRERVRDGRLQLIEDMWVDFAAGGVSMISALALHAPGPSRIRDPWGSTPILVFRSSDGGERWDGPVAIRARSADAPKLATRDSLVIVAVQVNAGDTVAGSPTIGTEQVAIYRSRDRGRSFQPTAFLATDDLGRNPLNPVFLSDSSMLVAWFDHPHFDSRGPAQHLASSRIFAALSRDGGQTFGLPHVVADVQRSGFPAVLRMVVDNGRRSRRRGRVYVVWNGGNAARSDVSLAFSDDSGSHWSAATGPTLSASAGSAVFTAAAVNDDGTLVLVWGQHETGEPRGSCLTIVFAASLDGAASFSAPRALANGQVCPRNAKNLAATFPAFGATDTAATAWPYGGDYIGLAVSADAVFHPVWVDTRDGPFRVYTSTITVR